MRLAWRKFVWSAGLLALFNCSGDTEPRRGQLMLALQTDMSVPKDVDRIRLQVLVGDTLQHDQNYPVSPEPNGTKLPATLAIVAGDQKNPTVQVRVIGIRGEGDDLLARTFAKVVTTVPTSRIATLRIPIQWLCDGTVREDGDSFESTCQPPGEDVDVEDERACVAGECKPVLVDSTLLPDYSPEDIFGGDPGPDGFSGVCFDTAPCFDAGFVAVPNQNCELRLNVPDNRELNVALQFPLEVDDDEGTGICGDEACYVPLDQDATYGWSIPGSGGAGGEGNDGPGEGEGGDGVDSGGLTTVKLPPSVCDRVDEGIAEAVRVTYACQTKTPRYPTCGPWSAVEDPPEGGVGGSVSTGSIATTTTGGGGTGVTGECASLTGETIDTGDPDIDAYVAAVRQLSSAAEQYREITEGACSGLLHQNVVGDLTEEELIALCQEASTEVQNLLSTGALNPVLAEGYCVSDMAVQQACEERCGVTSLCGDDQDFRCPEVVGDCEQGGTCQDGCYGDREIPTECAGNCFGECMGSCSGRCTLADGTIAVEGCSGMCQGICTGECAGNCMNSEACSTTCLAPEPADVCGGAGENITCRAPLSAEMCAENMCAVSCEVEAAVTRVCKVSVVSTYPSATSEGEPVSSEDRETLETNLGPLADVVLQTVDLESTIQHLVTAVSAIGEQVADDPTFLEPEALVCFSEAAAVYSQAILDLQTANASAVAVVNSFYFTDVSIPAGGSGGGGNGGVGGTGGTGGVPPDGGSGGTSGESAGGSSAGGSSSEVCVTESCTSDAECGPGICPLGTCNLAQTDCSTSEDCPADFCDEAAGFTCHISGAFCEIDEHCIGRDLCSRVCDCDGPGTGGTGGAGGTPPTGTGGGGGSAGSGAGGAGGTGGTGGASGGGGAAGTSGTGGGGGTAGSGGGEGSGGAGGGGGASGFGGVGGGGGTGGSGGTGGTGGTGGASGFGGVGGGTGGSSGGPSCGFGADPSSCEICLTNICCSSVTACDEDPFCGPVTDPYSQVQCIVSCHGGFWGPATSECEASCGVDGQLSDATHSLLSCSAECGACTDVL